MQTAFLFSYSNFQFVVEIRCNKLIASIIALSVKNGLTMKKCVSEGFILLLSTVSSFDSVIHHSMFSNVSSRHLHHWHNKMRHMMVHNSTRIQLFWTYNVSSALCDAVWCHQKCKRTFMHRTIHQVTVITNSVIIVAALYLCLFVSWFHTPNIINNCPSTYC